MAFFVMLYSMAEMDTDKFNAFLAGLQGTLRLEAAASPVAGRRAGDEAQPAR